MLNERLYEYMLPLIFLKIHSIIDLVFHISSGLLHTYAYSHQFQRDCWAKGLVNQDAPWIYYLTVVSLTMSDVSRILKKDLIDVKKALEVKLKCLQKIVCKALLILAHVTL